MRRTPTQARDRFTLAAALAAVLVAAIALSACGGDDTPSDDELSRDARDLVEDIRALQRDVTASGRSLVEGDEQARERAGRELGEQERRARELADRAERELPEDEQASEELREAAERTADTVGELRRFARRRDDEALQRAREQLEDAERTLGSAAEEIRRDAPEDVREDLDELRERLPEIPQSF